MINFKNDHDTEAWDALLAQLGGHPLQSALWGEAKRAVYGVSDKRLAIYDNDKLLAMIRLENKGLKHFLKLAWVPQGPVLSSDIKWNDIQNIILTQLKKARYCLSIISPWLINTPSLSNRKTVWIDLNKDKEQLWEALDKQWRYGVRSAHRLGVQVCFAQTREEVSDFYKLCIAVSRKKEFRFQYSESFLQYLLDHSNESSVEAKLFLIKQDDIIAAGAFILCVGKNCHYMFGGVDRKYSKYRLGECVQWSVIEWAQSRQCKLYDLEGIDEVKNPGVAAFKKKMGGEVVDLQNAQVDVFNWAGKILSKLIRKKLQ